MQLYRPATWDDIYYVADHMRDEDQDECRAGGLTPYEALALSFERCQTSYTLLTPSSGLPAAVMGVGLSPVTDKLGTIWMLGTDDIRKHKFTFIRQCKPFLKFLYEETGKEGFYNYTYAENDLHHQWLRWLGFSFLRKVELPPYGYSFYEFVRLKDF